jgi:hypothetical protein
VAAGRLDRPAAFSYHRSVAPMLLVLVGISVVEMAIVHLVAAFVWGWRIALPLSLVSIAGIVWLLAAVRSFSRLPVMVDDDRVLLRVGRIKAIEIARANVAGVDGEISAEECKRRDVLKLSLLAHPNTVVTLREPVPFGRRTIARIAHRLDDPRAFAMALA